MFAVGRQPERACRVSPNWIDANKRHFIANQSGDEGPVPENIDSLSQRPSRGYFSETTSWSLSDPVGHGRLRDGEMVEYLDLVGKIHTPAAGSQTLDVPLVQMNALLRFVSTAFLTTIVSCGLERCGTVCRWSVWF